jgi:phenylacetate-CoA ligase
VSEIMRRHREIVRARLIVSGEAGSDEMRLHCEVTARPEGLEAAIAASIREVTKLRGDVVLVATGSLPNDGKVIEDARKYS